MQEMCYECGVFFPAQTFEVTDLSNFNIKRKRDYRKLDDFKEVLNQLQAKRTK